MAQDAGREVEAALAHAPEHLAVVEQPRRLVVDLQRQAAAPKHGRDDAARLVAAELLVDAACVGGREFAQRAREVEVLGLAEDLAGARHGAELDAPQPLVAPQLKSRTGIQTARSRLSCRA